MYCFIWSLSGKERKSICHKIKSYFSAIKHVLKTDGYPWNDDKVVLASIIQGCKHLNDRMPIRQPIKLQLLEMILFEIERMYMTQPYLEILYKAMIIIGYYGLLRVGELADGPHTIKACNIHISLNKKKILIILFSSKMHNAANQPQEIKIMGKEVTNIRSTQRFFCPFAITRMYLRMCGGYLTHWENFFVFRDRTPVKPMHLREVLKTAIKNIGLNPELYNVHSLRIGHATQLFKSGKCVEYIKQVGRWKSNAVCKYLKS